MQTVTKYKKDIPQAYHRLFDDFVGRGCTPRIALASLEYSILALNGTDITIKEVAEWYDCSDSSISRWYPDIIDAIHKEYDIDRNKNELSVFPHITVQKSELSKFPDHESRYSIILDIVKQMRLPREDVSTKNLYYGDLWTTDSHEYMGFTERGYCEITLSTNLNTAKETLQNHTDISEADFVDKTSLSKDGLEKLRAHFYESTTETKLQVLKSHDR